MGTGKKLEAILKRGFRAAKCLTMLKLTTSRIKVLRNKKSMAVTQMRREIAALLQARKDSQASIKVDMLIKEQNTLEVYELIDQFARSVLTRMPLIEAQRVCPLNMKEPIASLIFAAPRCPDLEELMSVREMFISKFGKDFAIAASELRPDSGVNKLLVEKLTINPATGQMKIKMMKDIAHENRISWTPADEIMKVPEKTPDVFKQGLQSALDRHHQPAESAKAGENTSVIEPPRMTSVNDESQPINTIANAPSSSSSLAMNLEDEDSTTIEWHDVSDEFNEHVDEEEDEQEEEEKGEEDVSLPEPKISELHAMLSSASQHRSDNKGESKLMIEEVSGQQIWHADSQSKRENNDSIEYKQVSRLVVDGKELSRMEKKLLTTSSNLGPMPSGGKNEERTPAMEAPSDVINPIDNEVSFQHDASPKEVKDILQEQFKGLRQMSNKLKQDFAVFDGNTNGLTSECTQIASSMERREDSPFSGSLEDELSSEASKNTKEQVTSRQEDYLQATSSYVNKAVSDEGLLRRNASIEEAKDVFHEQHNVLKQTSSIIKQETPLFNKIEEADMGYVEKSKLAASPESKHHGSEASEMERNGFSVSLQYEVPSGITEATWEENPFFYWNKNNSVEEEILPGSIEVVKEDEVTDKGKGYRNTHMHVGRSVEEDENNMGNIHGNKTVVSSRPSSPLSKVDEDLFIFSSSDAAVSGEIISGMPIFDDDGKDFDNEKHLSESDKSFEDEEETLGEHKFPNHGPAWYRSGPFFSEKEMEQLVEEACPIFDDLKILGQVPDDMLKEMSMKAFSSNITASQQGIEKPQDDAESGAEKASFSESNIGLEDDEDLTNKFRLPTHGRLWNGVKPLFSEKEEERVVKKELPIFDEMNISRKPSDHILEEMPWVKSVSSRKPSSSRQDSGKGLFDVDPEEDKLSFSESNSGFEDESLAEKFQLPMHGRLRNKPRPLLPDKEKEDDVNLASKHSYDVLEEMPSMRSASSWKMAASQQGSGQDQLDMELGEEKMLSPFTQLKKSMKRVDRKNVLYDEPRISKVSDRFSQENQVATGIHQKELKWSSKTLKREDDGFIEDMKLSDYKLRQGYIGPMSRRQPTKLTARDEQSQQVLKGAAREDRRANLRSTSPSYKDADNKPSTYSRKYKITEEFQDTSLGKDRTSQNKRYHFETMGDSDLREIDNSSSFMSKTMTQKVNYSHGQSQRSSVALKEKTYELDDMDDVEEREDYQPPPAYPMTTKFQAHGITEEKRKSNAAAFRKEQFCKDDEDGVAATNQEFGFVKAKRPLSSTTRLRKPVHREEMVETDEIYPTASTLAEQQTYGHRPPSTVGISRKEDNLEIKVDEECHTHSPNFGIDYGKSKQFADTKHVKKQLLKEEDGQEKLFGPYSHNKHVSHHHNKTPVVSDKDEWLQDKDNDKDMKETDVGNFSSYSHYRPAAMHHSNKPSNVRLGKDDVEVTKEAEQGYYLEPLTTNKTGGFNHAYRVQQNKKWSAAVKIQEEISDEEEEQKQHGTPFSTITEAHKHNHDFGRNQKTPNSTKQYRMHEEHVGSKVEESHYRPAAMHHSNKPSNVTSDKQTWMLGKDDVEVTKEADQGYYLEPLTTIKTGGSNHEYRVQQNKKWSAAVKIQEEISDEEEEQKQHGTPFSTMTEAHKHNHDFGRNQKAPKSIKQHRMHEEHVESKVEEGKHRSHMPTYTMLSKSQEPVLVERKKQSTYHPHGTEHFNNLDEEELDGSFGVAVENRKDAFYQGFGIHQKTKPSTTSASTWKQIRYSDDDSKTQKYHHHTQPFVNVAEKTRASGDYIYEEYLSKASPSNINKKLEQQEEVGKPDEQNYNVGDLDKVKPSAFKKKLQQHEELSQSGISMEKEKKERGSWPLLFSQEPESGLSLNNTTPLKASLVEKKIPQDKASVDDHMISVAAYKKSAREPDDNWDSIERQGLSTDLPLPHPSSSPQTKQDSLTRDSVSSSKMGAEGRGKPLLEASVFHSPVAPPARPPPARPIRSTKADISGDNVDTSPSTNFNSDVPLTTLNPAMVTATTIVTAPSDSVGVLSTGTTPLDRSSTAATVEKLPTSTSAPIVPIVSSFSSTSSNSSFKTAGATSTVTATPATQPPLPHVHPKLPDFDDLAARMQALRQYRNK